MAMRMVKLSGETCAPLLGMVRHFTTSRSIWVAGAQPDHSPGSATEGSVDTESSSRESVAEGLENATTNVKQQQQDAGKADSAEEELQEKPVTQVGIEKVRDNLAGGGS